MSKFGGRRRVLVLSSLAIITMLVSVLTAPAAYADSTVAFTRESPQGGFGVGYWYNSPSNYLLSACDYGDPDGRRTVAIIEIGSAHYEAHAASGSGTCSGYVELLGLTPGSIYWFRACLRNGATGSDVYCSEWLYGYIN